MDNQNARNEEPEIRHPKIIEYKSYDEKGHEISEEELFQRVCKAPINDNSALPESQFVETSMKRYVIYIYFVNHDNIFIQKYFIVFTQI